MNRAERRRLQKEAKKAKRGQEANHSPEQQSLNIRQTLDLAVQHQNAGRLPEAKSIYQQILQADPNQPHALHLLGVIAIQAGKNDIAVDLITKALAINPDFAVAHYNLGNALNELGKFDEAVASFQKALAIKPDYVEAHNNLANVLQLSGKLDEAIASYHKALTIKPDYAEAHNNLGLLLKELGRPDEAVECFQKALAINPDYVEAHNNLGSALHELGKFDEAVASYQKVLAIKPDYVKAHKNIAIALNSYGRRSEALDHFKSGMELEWGGRQINSQHKYFRFINKSKMNHDIEQFRYLASLGHETARFQALVKDYEAVDSEINWPNTDSKIIPLSDNHRQRIGDTYNRPIHVLEASEMTGSTLSNTIDVEKITANYFAHDFGMTYFDNLLNPLALASLRRFLLGSTIWFDFYYRGGYLGAMLADGLACPLLLQIADDLRLTFPDIFKNHQLNQLWAYKYDSRLTGIEAHADFAAVNVNFWITPDTANLNSKSGGLILYNVEAPMDWNFKSYNIDQKRVRSYISDSDSSKIVVPYGENRLVLFNSNLFHESDAIDFKQGYENRRINVTMLFGQRGN
jgi:tetratricopeptide (TPR) repeat protein